MKLYSALVKKNEEGKISDAKLLIEGFSFFAFLFGPLWFFYHKMWQEFFVLLVADIVLGFFGGFDHLFLEVSLALIVALIANHWLEEHLQKNNYNFEGVVFAEDFASAQSRFAQSLFNVGDEILNPQLCHKKAK